MGEHTCWNRNHSLSNFLSSSSFVSSSLSHYRRRPPRSRRYHSRPNKKNLSSYLPILLSSPIALSIVDAAPQTPSGTGIFQRLDEQQRTSFALKSSKPQFPQMKPTPAASRHQEKKKSVSSRSLGEGCDAKP